MVSPPSDQKNGELIPRLLSTLVLVPPTLIAIYLGSPWFEIIVGIVALLMAWEWARICSNGQFHLSGWLVIAGVIGTIGTMVLGVPSAALIWIFVSTVVVFFLQYLGSSKSLAIGIVLIGAFTLSVLWIRGLPETGRVLTIWLAFTVWCTDIGGYFVGRGIGGAKLAPRLSPNKTWAGLVGGLVLASIWSGLWLSGAGYTDYVTGMAVGIGVAVFAQLGDLLVSAVKRKYQVKDSSSIIPGHGGVLDRLDSMLLTTPMVAIVLLMFGGGGA
tara:strand:- start:7701 stop:8513 length:813 start_codon:yes stop_codon:yes gene_type:complete